MFAWLAASANAAPQPPAAQVSGAGQGGATEQLLSLDGTGHVRGVVMGGRPLTLRAPDWVRRVPSGGLSVHLIGPMGPEVAATEIQATSGRVNVKPAQDLLPGSDYVMSLSGKVAAAPSTKSLVWTVFFHTQALPAAPIASQAEAEAPELWAFHPTERSVGNWRTDRGLPAFVQARYHTRPELVSTPTVEGIVLQLNDEPLAGVRVALGGREARTDAQGHFTLDGLSAGPAELVVDGSTAAISGSDFPQIVRHVDVAATHRSTIMQPVYLPQIHREDWFEIESPTREDHVVRHPFIPGLEVHIPKGTVLRDPNGRILTRFALMPVPIDRAAINMPVQLGAAVMFHPGGTRILNTNGNPVAGGIHLVYPNYAHRQPSEPYSFWAHDAHGNGWVVYDEGRVSSDGRQVMASNGLGLREFVECGVNLPNVAAPVPQPPADDCSCGYGLDPVELSTGLFIHEHTEVQISDVVPITFRRTYRPGDSVVRPFGIGTTHNYAMYLTGNGPGVVTLALPTGAQLHFVQGFTYDQAQQVVNEVWQYFGSPGPFYGASATYAGTQGLSLTLTDGTIYQFSTTSGVMNSMTDANGNQVTLNYNTAGQLAAVVSPSGRYIDLLYDPAGRISTLKDNAGRTWGYQYTPAGYLQQVTFPDLTTEVYGYDSLNRMTTVVDRRGNTMVTNTYDASNRISKQVYPDQTFGMIAYTTNASGQAVTTVTDENGNQTQTTFNAAGYPINVVGAPGVSIASYGNYSNPTTTYVRNASNLVMSATDPIGRTTAYTYNTNGKVTQLTKLYGTPAAASWNYTYTGQPSRLLTVTDPLGNVSSYTYDRSGNLLTATDALNNVTTLTYTSFGQVQSIITVPNTQPVTSSFSYLGGDLASVTDQLGRVTSFSTDELGRRIESRDALGNATTYAWDNMDRLRATVDPLGDTVQYLYDNNGNLQKFTDANGNSTLWSYDLRNRVIKKTDALGQVETYGYDNAGKLNLKIDRLGQYTGISYDVLNRRAAIGFGGRATAPTAYASTVVYKYDSANRNMITYDSATLGILRQYDLFDNLVSEQTSLGTIVATGNSVNQRTSLTIPGQAEIIYMYDPDYRLKQISQGAVVVVLQYDGLGRRSNLTLGNGNSVTYSWDNANQLQGLLYKTSTAGTLGNLTYGYDAAGRRTSMGGSLASLTLPTSVAKATYDGNNRLMKWGSQTLTYDANGNLKTDGQQTYTWDARLQLASVGGTSFTYDGVGRRIAANSGGVTTNFMFDGAGVVQELMGTTVTANLLRGAGPDELLRRTDANGTTDVLADGLGSTVGLTGPTGAIATSYGYGPYGAASSTGTVSLNRYQYTGRDNDGTGLYYNRARYYSPTYSQFISEDPIGLGGGVNWYAYVDGNPVSYVDPTGEIAFVPILIGIGVGYAFDYALEQYKKAHCTCQDTPAGAAGNAAAGGAVGGAGPFASKPRGGIAGGGPSGTATSSFSQMNHAAASRGWYSLATRNGITKVLRKVPYAGAALAAYELYDAFSCD